jgi:hypothetical protein
MTNPNIEKARDIAREHPSLPATLGMVVELAELLDRQSKVTEQLVEQVGRLSAIIQSMHDGRIRDP